jgi:uncharacterized protein involved in outer membrane biogenesis
MEFLKRVGEPRLRLAGFSLAGALVLFTVLGFFVLPPILKSVLADKLTQALHRPVTIDEIKVNPYALSLTVRGFRVGERQGPDAFFSVDELYVNAQLSSILRWGAVLKEIRLTRPAVRLVRHAGERYNFSDLLAPAAPPATAEPPGSPPRFSLNNIQVLDGRVDFVDEPVQRTHTVRQLQIGIPFLSNIPSYVEVFVEPRLEARINDDPYVIAGKAKPFANSLESSLQIDIRELDIAKYLAYVPVPVKFKIPTGQLDITATVTFSRQQLQQTLTVQGDVVLKGLAVTDLRDAPVIALPSLTVGIAPTHPLERRIHLSQVRLESPDLTVRRERDGRTNVETILPDSPPAQPAALPPAPAAAPAPPLTFLVDAIEIVQGRVSFADAHVRRPFRTTLHPIDVSVRGLGNEAKRRGSFTATLLTEAKEEVRAEGEVGLTPLVAEVKAATKGLALAKYAPYYRDRLRFDVEGKLDAAAAVSYAAAEPAPTVRASDVGVSLSGLKLRMDGESEEFVRIPDLAVTGGALDLQTRELSVEGFATRQGFVRVRREPDGAISLTRLLAPTEPAPAPVTGPAQAAEPERPWLVRVGRAAIERYAVRVEDRATTPAATLLLDNIRLRAEKLSTAKKAAGKVELSATLDGTSTLSVATTLGLDPLQADGKFEARRLAPARYAPYYREQVLLDIEEGLLDLEGRFAVAGTGDKTDVTLAGVTVGVESLRLRSRGAQEDFLSVPTLSVRNAALDLRKRQLVIGEIATQQGALQVKRAADGTVNLLGLVPPAAGGRVPDPAAAAPAAVAPSPTPWQAAVGSISLQQYRVRVRDEVPAEPVSITLDDIRLTTEGLSTEPGKIGSAALSLRVEKGGTLRAEGRVGIAPLTADLKVDVKAVSIRPFQPYFTDKVRVVVDDGSVSTAGRLSLAVADQTGLTAGYSGELLVASLATVDKENGEDVLRWEALSFGGIDVGHNPLRVHFSKVALSNYYARVIIQKDGRINLLQILKKDASPAPAAPVPVTASAAPPAAPVAPTPAGPSDIVLQEVTLQGGKVEFTDRSVTPTYTATLTELGGRVSGLSSAESAMADVNLRGRYEDSAPLEIVGKMNPLRDNLYANLKILYRDMDLSGVSPYSGKYIGHTIQKGKLSLDLEYLIDGRRLTSTNKVFLDQLTLGDKVESQHATRLPVSLGIALLKDRNGEIHLDLPVTGSLDDPQFSVWGVIVKILGNLLAKAATSPMALLGAVFGGGDELRFAEFEYGTTALTAASGKKMEALTKAMRERPGVKLDIVAYVDAERDAEALRKAFFDRKLRAQKALDVSRRGSRPPSSEQVTIEPAEYERYLRAAYEFETFPKPRNAIGLTRRLPRVEMEKLMFTHIQVSPDDLRALAGSRAQAVKSALVNAQVAPERIFIVERAAAPEAREGQRASRVEFAIK